MFLRGKCNRHTHFNSRQTNKNVVNGDLDFPLKIKLQIKIRNLYVHSCKICHVKGFKFEELT